MLRTVALFVLPAALIASAWTRLEDGGVGATGVGLLVLALLPALVRPWWGKALAATGVSLVAAETIYGVSVTQARPFDGERDFFGPVLSQFREGFLAFYDVPQPFPVAEHPLMHAIVLTAIFGFALATALAVGSRRPLVASAVLLVASIWPSTLVPGSDLARGAVTLAVVLSLLAFGGRRPTRALRPAAVAAALLVAAAVGASTSDAVAKGEFVHWKDWDLYDKPVAAVGVSYVWEASYRPLQWPEEETTVLTVSGPQRKLYWRATTLDSFRGHRWVESLPVLAVSEGGADLSRLADPLMPERAFERDRWVRADVKIEALRDDHLVGPSMPVRYDAEDLGVVHLSPGGVARVAGGVRRGDEYTVWAFAPAPKPKQLAGVRQETGDRVVEEAVRRYLEVAPGRTAPAFGVPGRDERMAELFGRWSRGTRPYRELYEKAREVVGEPGNQYAAVVALEAWFRSEGGFEYDEAPPAAAADVPPLVAFTLGHQRGYCQFYAGSMALMLRYLGIPARVAVGFTSGTPNEANTKWTVTDHDAHAWVEVWFPGWGWLPFDPTPARGQLSNPYSFGSERFDAAGAAAALAGVGAGSPADAIFNKLTEARAGEQFFRGPDVPGPSSYVPFVRDRGASLLRLLIFVAAATAAAIVLVKTAVRRRRFLTRDGRRLASACRRDLADFLADQGIELPRSATPHELGAELHRTFAVDATAFVETLAAARYAPPRESRAAARRVRRELRAVRRRIRASLGVPRRLRGAVSLRSLAA